MTLPPPRRSFIWDTSRLAPRATNPGGLAEDPPGGPRAFAQRIHHATPIWSCSGWGLPCRRCCQLRGALLPHLFTLTQPSPEGYAQRLGKSGIFSVALSLGSPPPDVIRHPVFAEPGLSSIGLSPNSDRPADWQICVRGFGSLKVKEIPLRRFAILLGGAIEPTARLRWQIGGARVIAADSGIRHARPLELQVESWIGDFDSSSHELQAQHKNVPRLQHPSDKAKTDGELAIDLAISEGATELILVGALGGASDHALAHLGLLLRLAAQKIAAFGSSGTEEAFPLVSSWMNTLVPEGSRLSVIPFTDLTGLTLIGVRWPLKDANVPLGSTLTVSNLVTGAVQIRLKEGQAIVVITPVTGV